MKITFKKLRDLVRGMISEAPEPKKKKSKAEPGELSDIPFTCFRHTKLKLIPRWRKVDMAAPGQDDPLKGAPEEYKGKRVMPPTSEYMPPSKKKITKSIIQHYVCPLWKDEGPYAVDPKTGEGHACDYKVSARITRPGQKYKYEARGEVAKEEGILYKPIRPRGSGPEVPQAFTDMVNKMEQEGFRWKASRDDKGKVIGFKRIPAEDSKRFSGDDVQYLSWFYPKGLGDDKKAKGDEYSGPTPYFFGAAKVVQTLLKNGWDYIESTRPEAKEKPKAMPSTNDRPVSPQIARAAERGMWHLTDPSLSSVVDPWDDDTNVDDNEPEDDEDVDVDDDDSIPERWR